MYTSELNDELCLGDKSDCVKMLTFELDYHNERHQVMFQRLREQMTKKSI